LAFSVRNRRARRVLLVLAVLFPAALALAQDAGGPTIPPDTTPPVAPVVEPKESSTSWEMTDKQVEAIDRGLVHLARWQQLSGRWVTTGGTRYHMSLTALAGLAFLAHGEKPGTGMYGAVLDKAVRYVVKNQIPENDPDGNGGLFFEPDLRPITDTDRPMHGHGFALLFLAEAYGQASQPELRAKIHEALVRAVKLTEKSQSQAGGWFYRPNDNNRDEGSITITQIQGLRAARNAGIQVSKTTVDRAVDYIRKSQLKSGDRAGGVRYTISYGDPSPALTSGGIAVYYGAGEYGSQGIELGFQYLSKNLRMEDRQHFWFYTHLYTVQAMHQKGGPEWASYFPKLRQQLLIQRNPRGEWEDQYGGPVFGTAVAVLCLEVPLRYLPIFQR
jgi:hypothetical protein